MEEINKYHHMSKKKKRRLKEYQKKYCKAKTSKKCKSSN